MDMEDLKLAGNLETVQQLLAGTCMCLRHQTDGDPILPLLQSCMVHMDFSLFLEGLAPWTAPSFYTLKLTSTTTCTCAVGVLCAYTMTIPSWPFPFDAMTELKLTCTITGTYCKVGRCVVSLDHFLETLDA